jgi:hypothetical protein
MNKRKDMSVLEENRRLREMCKKYLSWLDVSDVNTGLENDLHNPKMWSPAFNKRKSKLK